MNFLIITGRGHHPLWHYFSLSDYGQKAMCKVCYKKLKYRNVHYEVNLGRHLQANHPDEFNEFSQKKNKPVAIPLHQLQTMFQMKC